MSGVSRPIYDQQSLRSIDNADRNSNVSVMGSISQHQPTAPAASFRKYLPDLSMPRFVNAKKQSPYEYVDVFRKTRHPPALHQLTETWESLLEQPFTGVTTDGNPICDLIEHEQVLTSQIGQIKQGLFELQDGGVDIERICSATMKLLDAASTSERASLQYPMGAREWRCWSNPEFLLRPLGLRLEELSDELAVLILKVLEATLSVEGYQKALAAMRINHFLGELVELTRVMNKYSYNFLLFGKPSLTEAWGTYDITQTSTHELKSDTGWSLYGHHLCLNVFLHGHHVSITPTFTGAEPNMIDTGEYAGTDILHQEGDLGLQLMQSIPPEQQAVAQTYQKLHDPKMLQTGDFKVDRWNPDDQRHLCGAFRDNRIVPYEGRPYLLTGWNFLVTTLTVHRYSGKAVLNTSARTSPPNRGPFHTLLAQESTRSEIGSGQEASRSNILQLDRWLEQRGCFLLPHTKSGDHL